MPHVLDLALLAVTWPDAGKVVAGMAAGAALIAPAITFARRPRLTLEADSGRTYSRVESDGCGYVRPLVSCSGWTRGAKGTRVMVESYRPQGVGAGGARTTLGGTPSLGWPSAQDGTDGSLTVHPGATRPIDLGALTRGPHRAGLVYGIGGGALSGQDESWHLHLGFAGGFVITDGRDVIPPGAWTIRVLVVADDAKTRRFDVAVSWNGDASDAQAALDSLTLKVRSA